MKIPLTLSLILLSATLFAQQEPYTVSRDTINLWGYIYDNTGKPLKQMHIQSTQLETAHNHNKLVAVTDNNGFFELKGAKLYDTLTIGPDIRYPAQPYYNRDSRSLVIYLPPAVVTDINANLPLLISQKRRSPKVTPTFTIGPDMGAGMINSTSTKNAEYPGGLSQLVDLIKKTIVYPEKAIKNNVEGTVQVKFTVDNYGKVTNFQVLRGVGYGCEDEVIRAIKKGGKWDSAINASIPVEMIETVSVEFKLTDN
jgi:TonB family protein